MVTKIADLRRMTDDELVARNDEQIHTADPGTIFRDELNARRTDRQTQTMIRLTWANIVLVTVTAVLAVVTLVVR